MRPGKCFRLTTKEVFDRELPAVMVPEMQRSDLTGMVLQLKVGGSSVDCLLAVPRALTWPQALGIDNIMRFDWLAVPPAETMVRALENLHALGVLDEDAK